MEYGAVAGTIVSSYVDAAYLIHELTSHSIVDSICMVQSARKAIRDKRIAGCPNCKEQVRDGGAQEEAGLRHPRIQGEESEHMSEVEERYRDEES